MRVPVTLVVWAWLGWQSCCSAQPDSPMLVRATTGDRKTIIGALVQETDNEIELHDLRTSKTVTLEKGTVRRLQKRISDSEAAQLVGPWKLLSWRIRESIPTKRPKGHVAEVDGSVVYLTLGMKAAIAPGDEGLVYRDEGEIKNPVTGELLGLRRQSVARIEITEVREKYSTAKVIGDAKEPPRAGDQVELERLNNAIAILPLVDVDGDETVAGRRFADSLCAELVRNQITVVERTLLGKVLDELSLQQSTAFDLPSAKRIGKQVGAYAIVTGSLLRRSSRVTVKLRLLEVETGKVLLTSSIDLSSVRFPGLSDLTKATSNETSEQAEETGPQTAQPRGSIPIARRRGHSRGRRMTAIPRLIGGRPD